MNIQCMHLVYVQLLPTSALHKNLIWKNTRPKAAKMHNKTKYLTICTFLLKRVGFFSDHTLRLCLTFCYIFDPFRSCWLKIEKSEDLLGGYSNIKVLLNCFFTSSQDYVGGNLKKTIEKDFKKMLILNLL